MPLNPPTLVTAILALVAGMIATPVLYQGFARRGKGVFYEKNFIIQRAPQYSTLVAVVILIAGHLAGNDIIGNETVKSILATGMLFGPQASEAIAWTGVAIFISGLVFMIGGWYSLGECFTTDAEVLDGHKVRKGGLLSLVMHPAYSGIIQSVLGASLAANCLLATAFTLFVVAPLWLNRAKYEESLLLESLGPEYKQYAEEMKWRRLVPKFFPIGV